MIWSTRDSRDKLLRYIDVTLKTVRCSRLLVAHQIQHGRISTNVSMAQIRLPIHSYRFCSGQSYFLFLPSR